MLVKGKRENEGEGPHETMWSRRVEEAGAENKISLLNIYS
jgi:hypothetical protein